MNAEVCCLVLTLMSGIMSDGSQTARFTHQIGYWEGNSAVAWLVDGPNPAGEIVLGVGAIGVMTMMARAQMTTPRTPREVRLAEGAKGLMFMWAIGHVAMVHHNLMMTGSADTVPIIIAGPIIIVRW